MASDYYEILGVERTTSTADIKRAYRRLARQYHPDVNNDDPTAEQKFKAISEAYAVLGDPRKRREYDLGGHPGIDWFFEGGLDVFQIFDQVFGGSPFAQTTRRRQGRSIQAAVSVTLEEVLAGTTRTIEYSRIGSCPQCEGSGMAPGSSLRRCPTCGGAGQVRQTRRTLLGVMTTVTVCPDCGGKGEVMDRPCQMCGGRGMAEVDEELEVTIPPGIANAQEMVIRGAGDIAPGGRDGDLYVVVHVEPHELFEREGNDLHTNLTISFAQATLGDTVVVPTLASERELTIPAGTQPGTLLNLSEEGLADLESGRRGDLIVHIQVAVPRQLTRRQRQLLEDFAAEQ